MIPRPSKEADSERPWRDLFYARLRNSPRPLIVFGNRIVPGASLWTGSRLWVKQFRAAGLVAGDRIVLATRTGPGFLYVLIAALCENLSLALLPGGEELTENSCQGYLEELDARLIVSETDSNARQRATGIARISADGLPDETIPLLRESRNPRTPEIRFMLRTSGTTREPRWTALTDGNIFSVLESHRPLLPYKNARVLSALPWSHAFGLVLELIPALLDSTEIIRDPEQGRDIDSLLALAREHEVTCFSTVPLLIRRLIKTEGGAEFLRGLEGGIVGGAFVPADLAEVLRTTRLRPGYGQTEAAPGITLGEPGQWQAGALGNPVGCETRINDFDELEFRGANLAAGIWTRAGLEPFSRDEGQAQDHEDFFPTGDLVARQNGQYVFRGRRDNAFKALNGRFIFPEEREARLLAALPAVRQAMLFCDDGENMQLLLDCELSLAPDRTTLEKHLGLPLARVRYLMTEEFIYTRKGALDRPATRRGLPEYSER